MSRRLHIFNPDTDFALAAKSDFYTPPRSVATLRDRNALFPATYAKEGDAILILDPAGSGDLSRLPWHDTATRKGLETIVLTEKETGRDFSDFTACPWGWNRVIRRFLADNFPSLRGVPDTGAIERITALSHRRTTIAMHRLMRCSLTDGIGEPREFLDTEEAMAAFREERDMFFKMPWSSSGRGIIRTDDLTERHVEPWVRGAIANQGSVMGETALDKKLDFATEWVCGNGEVRFMGYSVFETSRRGKYKRNIDATQSDLLDMIREAAPGFGNDMIELQRDAIAEVVAPGYSGPLGIDMLATRDGRINPCVEMNLRMTMGMGRGMLNGNNVEC